VHHENRWLNNFKSKSPFAGGWGYGLQGQAEVSSTQTVTEDNGPQIAELANQVSDLKDTVNILISQIQILRCRDLLPFIWSGCSNKWLVVVVERLHLKNKWDKTDLAVMFGLKAMKKLLSTIQSTDGMLVCMPKNVMKEDYGKKIMRSC
jgi:hypothetical protein